MPVVVEEGNHAYYTRLLKNIQILYFEHKFVYWCLKENNDNSSHSMQFFFLNFIQAGSPQSDLQINVSL